MTEKTNRRVFIDKTLTLSAGTFAITRLAPSTAFGANERVRLGGIGTGDRGTDRIRTAKRLGAEIVALADVNEAMLDRCETAIEQKTQRYKDHKELLARQDIDGVIIASPDHWHHDMVIDALAAKKDIYIEKPFSRTIEEGQDMVESGQEFQTDHPGWESPPQW